MAAILSGIISELNAVNGFIKCDNQSFGYVFMPVQSDRFLSTIQCNIFDLKVGDRVSFIPHPANKQHNGYVASHVKKVLVIDKTENNTNEAIGRVYFVNGDFGVISFGGSGFDQHKAFFSKIHTALPCTNLQQDFPLRSAVSFVAVPYKFGKKFKFTATKVQKVDENQLSSVNEEASTHEKSVQTTAVPLFASKSSQTENYESHTELFVALKKVLECKPVYHAMLLDCPDEAQKLIEFVYKNH